MGYPVAMDMSDDGKMLAVTYFHTDDAVLKSKVIYYNFGESGKDKPDKIVASDEFQTRSWQTFSLWEATALL